MTTPSLLLVDDDPLVCEMLGAALREAGFSLVAVANGSEALAELGADAARFRVVVTDIDLGAGPDGWAIGRRARERMPEVPVIYMSGASAREWFSEGVPNSVMLNKPFDPSQLITAVATLTFDADAEV